LEKLKGLKEADKQRKIAAFESARKPVKHASLSAVEEIGRRMSDEARIKEERLTKQRQEQQDKEDASVVTRYNHSDHKYVVGSEGPWEDWYKGAQRIANNRESDRQKAKEEESRWLEENSVHRNGAKANDIACERLYEDYMERQQRYYAKQQQEAARDLTNCLLTIGKPGSVNIEDVVNYHLQDAKRRLDGMSQARQKIYDDILDQAGVAERSSERQARALEHASGLHQQWDRHQRYMLLLQDRFREAQDELLWLQSVHPEAPEDWGPEAVKQMVKRLYPEPNVTHPYKDKETRAKEKEAKEKEAKAKEKEEKEREAMEKEALAKAKPKPKPKAKRKTPPKKSSSESKDASPEETQPPPVETPGPAKVETPPPAKAPATVAALEDPLEMGALLDEGLQLSLNAGGSF